jgi:hypothetical protein
MYLQIKLGHGLTHFYLNVVAEADSEFAMHRCYILQKELSYCK